MTQRIEIAVTGPEPDHRLLTTEWLLTNGRGSYASSTVVGCNTRKYHGLLVAAVRPAALQGQPGEQPGGQPGGQPGERAVLLSGLVDEIVLDGRECEKPYPLACFEFAGSFHPRGDTHLVAFEQDKAAGCVRFIYRLGKTSLTKTIVLARQADAICVRYELAGKHPRARLLATPLFAYRHYHSNRTAASQPALKARRSGKTLRLEDAAGQLPPMRFDLGDGEFLADGKWWYRFFYRIESERGEHGWEDLFAPGCIQSHFDADGVVELRAAVEPFHPIAFSAAIDSQGKYRQSLLATSRERTLAGTSETGAAAGNPVTFPRGSIQDLLLAADDFVVELPDGPATILAGYHWFADWGRDSFISLPGLLLATGAAGRAELAHGVLIRFARAIRNGLVPNRFSDEPVFPSTLDPRPSTLGVPCDYNSVDAGLWFINAAFAWASHTADWARFDRDLLAAARSILDAYHAGTDFNIHVDADGLLIAGKAGTQVTWMDAMVDGRAITPRAGKPVEVNALYGHALRLVSDRLAALNDPAAAVYCGRRERWQASFAPTFASRRGGLYDFIGLDGRPNDLIRPNQVLAVSLGDSALPVHLQRQVIELARERLLTPFGLRSLAPGESGYRHRCSGSRLERDEAYHQGTVWAWLIGPFLEGYLRVEAFSASARRQAAIWLEPLLEHMHHAGLGQIGEIFDADPPHAPRGCIAQAWSVAEVLRLMCMIQQSPGAGG